MFKKKSDDKKSQKPEIDLDFGGTGLFGGFMKGLSNLIDLADKVGQEGGKIERTGEFRVKGQKDMTGVYGFSIRTMTGPGGVPHQVVRPFGDITKVKKTPRPKGPIVEGAREPMVDIIDEGDFIRLVAELPGVAESELECGVQGDDVVQITTTGKTKYSKEVLLPAKVDPKSLDKSYTNGVLELKLSKVK